MWLHIKTPGSGAVSSTFLWGNIPRSCFLRWHTGWRDSVVIPVVTTYNYFQRFMSCNGPRQSCYLFAVIDLEHLSSVFSWLRAILLRNGGESQHCHWVTVRYACKIKNVTQQSPAEDLMASKLKPVAFCFTRWQCKHVCLQAWCSAGLTWQSVSRGWQSGAIFWRLQPLPNHSCSDREGQIHNLPPFCKFK